MATRLHRLGSHAALFLSLLAALLLLSVGWLQSVSLIPLYFLFYLLCSSAAVIQETVLQHQIESQGRSTVHSVVSLATNMHAILVFSLLGLISRVETIILSLGLYMLVSTSLIGFLKRRAFRRKPK
jgi:cobalamin synthase